MSTLEENSNFQIYDKNLKIVSLNIQEFIQKEYPLNIFTNSLLFVLTSYMTTEDFVKFVFSLPKTQKQFIFQFLSRNFMTILNDKYEEENFLDSYKFSFKINAKNEECLTYDSKILFSTKNTNAFLPKTHTKKLKFFQIHGKFISFQEFHHDITYPNIFYFFESKYFLALHYNAQTKIFSTQIEFFGKINVEKVTFNRGKCSSKTQIRIPEDLNLLNLNDNDRETIDTFKTILKNGNIFGKFIDKICCIDSFPKFSKIFPIILFRVCTSILPIVLLPSEFNEHKILINTLIITFNLPSRIFENYYYFFYLDMKKFKSIFRMENGWLKPFVTKYFHQGAADLYANGSSRYPSIPFKDLPFFTVFILIGYLVLLGVLMSSYKHPDYFFLLGFLNLLFEAKITSHFLV